MCACQNLVSKLIFCEPIEKNKNYRYSVFGLHLYSGQESSLEPLTLSAIFLPRPFEPHEMIQVLGDAIAQKINQNL